MFELKSGAHQLLLDEPKVMGILNVTPDSFSDGGRFSSFELACRHADQMVADGAVFIDIGGESTGPELPMSASMRSFPGLFPWWSILSPSIPTSGSLWIPAKPK